MFSGDQTALLAMKIAQAAELEQMKAVREELEGLRLLLRWRREMKYSPEQPRDVDGRWMPWEHGEAPDGTPVEPAGDSNEPLVNLLEEEREGGHTIAKHVDKNPEQLREYVRQTIRDYDDPTAHNIRSGSFSSLEAANRLVNATLERNRDIVEAIANGTLPEQRINAFFSSVTGIEAVARTTRSQPHIRETFGVGVYIRRDASSSRGYRIVTAYPRNAY